MTKTGVTYKQTDSENIQLLPTKYGYEYFTFRNTKLDTSWIAENNKSMEAKV